MSQTLKKQVAQANLNLNAKRHSAQSYLDESLNISKLPFLVVTPDKAARINRTSTINNTQAHYDCVRQQDFNASPIESRRLMTTISLMDITEYDDEVTPPNNAFSNQLYTSPLVSHSRKNNGSIDSSNSWSDSQTFHDAESYGESEHFQTVSGSFFDRDMQENNGQDVQQQLYFCCQVTQTNQPNHLSLDLSENVRLIYSKNDYCFVESVASGKRGFVPSSAICSVGQRWINNTSINL